MIRTQVGNVENFRAIVENADPIVRLTVNDWPARACGETARSNARLFCQRVAQRRLCMQLQIIFTENSNLLSFIGLAALDFSAAYHDAFYFTSARRRSWALAGSGLGENNALHRQRRDECDQDFVIEFQLL